MVHEGLPVVGSCRDGLVCLISLWSSHDLNQPSEPSLELSGATRMFAGLLATSLRAVGGGGGGDWATWLQVSHLVKNPLMGFC